MDGTPRRCALPGCDAEIRDEPGRPPRRYCTAAHRSAARHARRAGLTPAAEAPEVDTRPAADDARLAAVLPWVGEPDAPEPAEGGASRGGGSDAARPEPARPDTARPDTARPDTARPVGSRVARGRRGTEPGTVATSPSRSRRVPLARRRRALAVLGAAGILVGGYAFTASQPTPPSSSDAQAAPEETEEQWADRARLALASVNRQLDSIAEVEAQWLSLPEERRATGPTGPVAALVERRELLERRRATLQSQLDSFQALGPAREGLAESQQFLDAVEGALADAPTVRTPEQEAALAALDEQRDLREAQRDARLAEVQALEAGVDDASSRPLPDDVDETTEVGNDVLEVIRGEDGEDPPDDDLALPDLPDVVNGRDDPELSPRQDVATSAPPDPRGPRDESGEVRDDPDALAAEEGADGVDPDADPEPGAGPVDEVVGALGDIASGDDSRRDRDAEPVPPAATAPAGSGEEPSGPVDDVVDAVDGVLGGGDGSPDEDRGSRDEPAAGGPAAEEAPDGDRGSPDEPSGGGSGEGPLEDVVGAVDDVLGGGGPGADEAPEGDRGSGDEPSAGGPGEGPLEDVVDAVDGVLGGGGPGADEAPDEDRGSRDEPAVVAPGAAEDLVDGAGGDELVDGSDRDRAPRGDRDEPATALESLLEADAGAVLPSGSDDADTDDRDRAPRADRDGDRGDRDEPVTELESLLDAGVDGADVDGAEIARDVLAGVPGTDIAEPIVAAALAGAGVADQDDQGGLDDEDLEQLALLADALGGEDGSSGDLRDGSPGPRDDAEEERDTDRDRNGPSVADDEQDADQDQRDEDRGDEDRDDTGRGEVVEAQQDADLQDADLQDADQEQQEVDEPDVVEQEVDQDEPDRDLQDADADQEDADQEEADQEEADQEVVDQEDVEQEDVEQEDVEQEDVEQEDVEQEDEADDSDGGSDDDSDDDPDDDSDGGSGDGSDDDGSDDG